MRIGKERPLIHNTALTIRISKDLKEESEMALTLMHNIIVSDFIRE